MWDKVVKLIRDKDNFVITSHINADGDAIGSEIGLYRFLKKLGKNVSIINPSPSSGIFNFLMDGVELRVFEPERDMDTIKAADAAFILDLNDLERAGDVGRHIVETGTQVIVIDHHQTGVTFGDIKVTDKNACSTGQLIYDLIKACGGKIDREIAEALYVAIVTDTGMFNFPVTDPKAHIVAADLLSKGVKPFMVHRKLNLMHSWEYLWLTGISLFECRSAHEGRIAYTSITHDIFKRYKPLVEELILMPQYLMAIKDVEVGILFLEETPGRVHVELRATGAMDVGEIAKLLGGGGHASAAGAVIEGRLDEIESIVINYAIACAGAVDFESITPMDRKKMFKKY